MSRSSRWRMIWRIGRFDGDPTTRAFMTRMLDASVSHYKSYSRLDPSTFCGHCMCVTAYSIQTWPQLIPDCYMER